MIDSTIERISGMLVVGFCAFGFWVAGVSYYHVITG